MALPDLTPEQRAANLAKAAAARHARAELLARVKDGTTTVAEVLASDDETCRRLPVRSLLKALPGLGNAKVAKIMEELGIPEKRRVAGLGTRQREALAEAVSREPVPQRGRTRPGAPPLFGRPGTRPRQGPRRWDMLGDSFDRRPAGPPAAPPRGCRMIFPTRSHRTGTRAVPLPWSPGDGPFLFFLAGNYIGRVHGRSRTWRREIRVAVSGGEVRRAHADPFQCLPPHGLPRDETLRRPRRSGRRPGQTPGAPSPQGARALAGEGREGPGDGVSRRRGRVRLPGGGGGPGEGGGGVRRDLRRRDRHRYPRLGRLGHGPLERPRPEGRDGCQGFLLRRVPRRGVCGLRPRRRPPPLGKGALRRRRREAFSAGAEAAGAFMAALWGRPLPQPTTGETP